MGGGSCVGNGGATGGNCDSVDASVFTVYKTMMYLLLEAALIQTLCGLGGVNAGTGGAGAVPATACGSESEDD